MFYLQFRHLNYKKETDFLHFLATSSIPSKFTENKAMMNSLLDYLNDNENVCVIMDGFDEANVKTDSPTFVNVDIHDSSVSTEDFIKNLFAGKILPKAKKLVTSRPRQFVEMPESFRPTFTTYILGLDSNAQRNICKSICGEKNEQVFSFKNTQIFRQFVVCHLTAL